MRPPSLFCWRKMQFSENYHAFNVEMFIKATSQLLYKLFLTTSGMFGYWVSLSCQESSRYFGIYLLATPPTEWARRLTAILDSINQVNAYHWALTEWLLDLHLQLAFSLHSSLHFLHAGSELTQRTCHRGGIWRGGCFQALYICSNLATGVN